MDPRLVSPGTAAAPYCMYCEPRDMGTTDASLGKGWEESPLKGGPGRCRLLGLPVGVLRRCQWSAWNVRVEYKVVVKIMLLSVSSCHFFLEKGEYVCASHNAAQGSLRLSILTGRMQAFCDGRTRPGALLLHEYKSDHSGNTAHLTPFLVLLSPILPGSQNTSPLPVRPDPFPDGVPHQDDHCDK